MPEDNQAATELRAVGDQLRAAVNAQDFEQALALLPVQTELLRTTVSESPDAAALVAESLALLHSCLHMVHAHREDAVTEYGRVSTVPSFQTQDDRGGTILVHG